MEPVGPQLIHDYDLAVYRYDVVCRFFKPQETGLDQHGRSAQFIKCANDAGLGWLLSEAAWNNNHSFNDENAEFINVLANTQGIDAGLLGFTFDHEGSFNQNAGPNPNGNPDPHGWDYGPFGLNYNQTIKDVNAGAYSLEGLNHKRIEFRNPCRENERLS